MPERNPEQKQSGCETITLGVFLGQGELGTTLPSAEASERSGRLLLSTRGHARCPGGTAEGSGVWHTAAAGPGEQHWQMLEEPGIA